MSKKVQRLMVALAVIFSVGIGILLIVTTFSDNMMFFYYPSDIIQKGVVPHGKKIRIGGLVKKGSLQRDGITVSFVVTDYVNDICVCYSGILPNLFKEGQGVVALGAMSGEELFLATEILAKHDENYMPPEVKAMVRPVN